MPTRRSRALATALIALCAAAIGGSALAQTAPAAPANAQGGATEAVAALPPPPPIAPALPGTPGRPPQLLLRPLDMKEINGVVRSRAGELRSCYDEARLLDPSLGAGVIAMQWKIVPSGSVAWVGMKSEEFRSPRLAACLTRVVLGMFFRNSTNNSVVTYPFRFEPPADE